MFSVFGVEQSLKDIPLPKDHELIKLCLTKEHQSCAENLYTKIPTIQIVSGANKFPTPMTI